MHRTPTLYKTADEWIAELRERKQAKGETYLQYRDALCTLALRAHGGDPDSASWLITQFCEGLHDREIGLRLDESNPPPPPSSPRLRGQSALIAS